MFPFLKHLQDMIPFALCRFWSYYADRLHLL